MTITNEIIMWFFYNILLKIIEGMTDI